MWLNRSLFQGPRVALVTSQRQFRALLQRIGAAGDKDSYCEPNWDACTTAYDVDGELVCIVGVNIARLARLPSVDAAAVLVHEAVHVWQRTRDAIGPGEIGREMEAYAVQNIAAGLMRAYVSASSSAAVAEEP